MVFVGYNGTVLFGKPYTSTLQSASVCVGGCGFFLSFWSRSGQVL